MITLAQLEREVALRCGPHWVADTDAQLPSTASLSYVNVPQLRSDVDVDVVTNLWLLRRGQLASGDAFSVSTLDRNRLVSSFDPDQGRVYVDHLWSAVPPAGEQMEFHHLHPQQELRAAVLAGLRRCFRGDRVPLVTPMDFSGEADLTETYPWLVSSAQVAGVQYSYPVGAPRRGLFGTFDEGGHVWLSGIGLWPYGIQVRVWRPAWTWVNGAESTSGPTNDTDQLDIDLDYAASAGHIEAWHHFPARLAAASAGGLQATQKMAADEFSRQSLIWNPPQLRGVEFTERFDMYEPGSSAHAANSSSSDRTVINV